MTKNDFLDLYILFIKRLLMVWVHTSDRSGTFNSSETMVGVSAMSCKHEGEGEEILIVGGGG